MDGSKEPVNSAFFMKGGTMPQTLPNLVLIAVTGAALVSIAYSRRQLNSLREECNDLRHKLRKKNRQNGESSKKRDEDDTKVVGTRSARPTLEETSLLEEGLTVKPIGVIRSIYRLCVGTPRQGLLAPNARGCIEMLKLGDSSAASSVSGLEGYSHIWVVFVFHLNTQSKSAGRVKSKISPPALGGQKVGIYATRTPHRYNPIGITLCKLDRIKVDKQRVTLQISGLDLVDGTPVLDIKPFVPIYDSAMGEGVKLPGWVEGGLAMSRSVAVSVEAKDELERILEENPLALQFYGRKYGEGSTKATLDSALEAIRQVLAIDVRSSYQTKKARSGKSQAERASRLRTVAAAEKEEPTTSNDDLCTQQLDNLLIHFKVEEAPTLQRSPSENSGAEDQVVVTSIRLLATER